MFVGHYAVALAAKRFAPKTSLGWSFAAVQFLDILWAPAILLGIEHARLIPGFLPASPFNLYDMPWTHSLLMALVWSWLFFRVTKVPVLGLCVFSHWLLDFIAHGPDLPLYRGGPVFGLGLWRFRGLTFFSETALLVLGLAMYMGATRETTPAGRYAIPIFVLLLIALGAYNLYGPEPTSISAAAITAETCYIVLAAVAWWLDRLRQPVIKVDPVPSILDA